MAKVNRSNEAAISFFCFVFSLKVRIPGMCHVTVVLIAEWIDLLIFFLNLHVFIINLGVDRNGQVLPGAD